MDKLFSAGKEFLEERNQGNQDNQYNQDNQGNQYNQDNQGQNPLPGGNKAHGGNYPAGGDFQPDGDDMRTAHQEANARAGDSGNSDMFSNILGVLGQNKSQIANQDLDEEDAVRQHKQAYQNDSGNNSEQGLGAAAAMQALKMFNQGETGQNQGQGAFLGLAMSEASKLFDNKAAQGKVQDGASKESTVQQAGEMAMKMYFKSQGQSQGGLMGMASKFM